MATDYACTVVAQEDLPQSYTYYLLSADQERRPAGFPSRSSLSISTRLLQDQAGTEVLRHLRIELTDARVRTVSDDRNLREWEYHCPSSPYYQRVTGKRPATFLDLGGDGLFDCLRRDGVMSYIRLNDQLTEVVNHREMPFKSAAQADFMLSPIYGQSMLDLPLRDAYGFIDGRWVVTESGGKLMDTKADSTRASPWTFPKISVPQVPKNSAMQRPSTGSWARTENMGFRFSQYPLDKQVINCHGRFLKLTTHFGQAIELHLSHQGKLLGWKLEGVCHERLSHDQQGRLLARAFQVGDFDYVDADGDGTFDSVHDKKRQVWLLIRLADLIKVGPPNCDSGYPVEFPAVTNGEARYRLRDHVWQATKAGAP